MSNDHDYILKITLMAIEERSSVAVFLTLLMDLILGKNYCIKSYARHKGIRLEDKWLK
jgi:hypothetical protein